MVGEKNTIGLSIKHAPHWHTTGKPGDSGYPTKITWQVPAGYGVGEFDWPTPKRLATGPIINFGYEGEVLLPLTVSVPTSAKPGEHHAERQGRVAGLQGCASRKRARWP